MDASCSLIPCVVGSGPDRLVIGIDVPVVPGKAILTIGVIKKRVEDSEI
jgi:hypothetical protein